MSIEEILVPTEASTEPRAVARYHAHSGDGPMQHVQSVRNDSSFVAQLIATADNLPQTRHRRRAEPRVAVAAYRVTLDSVPCNSTRRVA